MLKFDIKHKCSGDVLFSAEINADEDTMTSVKIGLAVKRALNNGAYLEGADLEGAYLRNTNLEGACLRNTNLEGADLEGAYLRNTNLEGAYLRNTNLEGADLEGAYLEGACLIDGGQDRRGYRFVGQMREDGDVNVMAGCRYFNSIATAREHWEGRHKNNPSLHVECLAKLDMIEAVAKARK